MSARARAQSAARGTGRVVSGGDDARRRGSAGDTNMRVMVRVRSTAEHRGDAPRLETTGPRGTQVTVVPVARVGATGETVSPGPSRAYTYDRVFSGEADQGMVYQDVAAHVLPDVLQGYNCTVFAYGQTGTGKTHTMEGDLASQGGTYAAGAGLIPRALFRLFQVLESRPEEHSVHISYVELYNEELRDLLAARSNAPLRMLEDARGRGVQLQGLDEVPLTSAEHGLAMLQRGSARRRVAATKCNDVSSRSHCVFTITVHMRDTGVRGEELMRTGKLNLVDLAGSENIGRSGSERARAREAGVINQSLLTLGRVINALVDGSAHIPYRESRLTRLLQDSLGGRTKTCLVATVSDDAANVEETISTLDYALRAKSIRSRPEVNQRTTRAALVHEYVEEITRLRADLAASRARTGIYVDADNYARMEREHAAQQQAVEEQRKRAELAESRAESVQEQLDQAMQLAARRAAQHEAYERRLAHAAKQAQLLEEERVLRDAHARSEQRLHAMAQQLMRVAEHAASDAHALADKVQRLGEENREARDALATFRAALEAAGAQCAAHVQEADAAAPRLDAALQEALHTLAERLAEHADEELGGTRAAVDALCARLSDALDAHSTGDEHLSELRESLGSLQAQLDGAAKRGAQRRAELEAYVRSVHEELLKLGHALDERMVRVCDAAEASAEAVRHESATHRERAAAQHEHTKQLCAAVAHALDASQGHAQRAWREEHERAEELQRSVAALLEGHANQSKQRAAAAARAMAAEQKQVSERLAALGAEAEQWRAGDAAAYRAVGDATEACRGAAHEAAEHEHVAALAAHVQDAGARIAGALRDDAAHASTHATEARTLDEHVRAPLEELLRTAHTHLGAAEAHARGDLPQGLERLVAALADAGEAPAEASAQVHAHVAQLRALLDADATQVRALRDAFAPMAQPTFLVPQRSGATPQRRSWDIRRHWDVVPSDRATALAQLRSPLRERGNGEENVRASAPGSIERVAGPGADMDKVRATRANRSPTRPSRRGVERDGDLLHRPR